MEHWLGKVSIRQTLQVSVVSPYRIYVHQWYTGKASHKGDELIQVVRAAPSNRSTEHDHEESEDILFAI